MKLIQTISDCCTSLVSEPLDRPAAESVAAAFKGLADPVRVQIVSRVAASKDGELCACDLPEVLGIAQPTVSHHLRVLVSAGLLEREQRGKWAFFSLAPDALETLRSLFSPA